MIRVAVVGASGYTGLELLKILISHPKFRITYIGATEAKKDVSMLHKSLSGVLKQPVEVNSPSDIAKVADLAFLALPHQTSMEYAKELLALGVKVVDLSADYRLSLEGYEENYCEHLDKENLSHAVYGLPEINAKKIKEAKLVANPGCYPTASLLAILPFLSYAQSGQPIIIDAKSGLSGAGKKLTQTSHFATINENMLAYNPFVHRHEPEIKEQIGAVGKGEFEVCFVPQLIPVTRGMLASVYIRVKDGCIDPIDVLRRYYKNSPFVRIRNKPVDIKSVAGTNFCDIFATKKGDLIFVSSAIDNLLRGASSQAVVNANLMYGFEQNLGIPVISYVP